MADSKDTILRPDFVYDSGQFVAQYRQRVASLPSAWRTTTGSAARMLAFPIDVNGYLVSSANSSPTTLDGEFTLQSGLDGGAAPTGTPLAMDHATPSRDGFQLGRHHFLSTTSSVYDAGDTATVEVESRLYVEQGPGPGPSPSTPENLFGGAGSIGNSELSNATPSRAGAHSVHIPIPSTPSSVSTRRGRASPQTDNTTVPYHLLYAVEGGASHPSPTSPMPPLIQGGLTTGLPIFGFEGAADSYVDGGGHSPFIREETTSAPASFYLPYGSAARTEPEQYDCSPSSFGQDTSVYAADSTIECGLLQDHERSRELELRGLAETVHGTDGATSLEDLWERATWSDDEFVMHCSGLDVDLADDDLNPRQLGAQSGKEKELGRDIDNKALADERAALESELRELRSVVNILRKRERLYQASPGLRSLHQERDASQEVPVGTFTRTVLASPSARSVRRFNTTDSMGPRVRAKTPAPHIAGTATPLVTSTSPSAVSLTAGGPDFNVLKLIDPIPYSGTVDIALYDAFIKALRTWVGFQTSTRSF